MTEKQKAIVSQSEVANPLVMVQQQIDAICERISVSETCRLRLRECERELIVHFPVKMDDGRAKVFTGYRVQHNDSRGGILWTKILEKLNYYEGLK